METCNRIMNLVLIIIFIIPCSKPVQLSGESITLSKKTVSKFDNINVCLKPDRPTNDYFSCFGHQMLRKLQDLEDREEFNLVDGVSMRRDESGPRDISNFLDKNPLDYRYLSQIFIRINS
jgi:hypothetical protein